MSLCPACSEEGTSPAGKKKSPYLLVFTKPYPAQTGWKGRTDGFEVLTKELFKVGLDIHDFRIAYLWLHEPTKNNDCYQAGKSVVLDEAKGKQAVILVGSDVTQEFCGLSSQDVAGLQVDSPLLSAPIVFVLPKPEGVFVRGAGIGELRLACQKLAKVLNE